MKYMETACYQRALTRAKAKAKAGTSIANLVRLRIEFVHRYPKATALDKSATVY